MKRLLFISIVLFFGCAKEPLEEIEQVSKDKLTSVSADTRSPKEGMWEGQITYSIEDVVSQTIHCQRQVKYLSDSTFDMRWWSSPDTSVLVQADSTFKYLMRYDDSNTSCGNQRTIIDFNTTSFVRNDTMFDVGTVHYRLYFNNELIKDKIGKLKAWSVWTRIIHY